MASKLTNVLQEIERGRRKCITNARLANLTLGDNASFDSIGNAFLYKNTPEPIPQVTPWQRPSDWWDCKSIIENAENIVEDGVTFYPAYIILIADWDKTTDLKKNYDDNYKLQGDGYLTSDGVWYNTADATHTWDTTKDKECSCGYKTRYIIVYTKTPNNVGVITLRLFKCLEVIVGNIKLNSNITFGYATTNKPPNRFIENFETLDTTSNIVFLTEGIFGGCRSLKHFKSSTLTTIASNMFVGCRVLTDLETPNITSIGEGAFSGAMSLQSIDFPNVTSSLGRNTFQQCYSLRYVNLPKVTTIGGDNTFQLCYALEHVNLPKLESISSSYTFNGCRSIKSIDLPNLTNISGNYTFQECSNLISVNLPKLGSIGSYTFYNCSNLSNVSLPELLYIGGNNPSGTFFMCPSLSEINLPKLTNLVPSMFYECNSLRDIYIPLVENIKGTSEIFAECYYLSKIDIPSSILTISGRLGDYIRYINLPDNFKVNGLSLSSNVGITRSSLVDMINKLADVTEETDTYTLTLGATNLAKLTAEEIAVGTDKGWVIN